MDKNKSLEYQGHKDLKSTVNLFEQVQKRITNLRDNQVILDVDIAELYNVETKRINEAVKNNPDKFPEDYMFKLTQEEVRYLRSNNSATNISPKSRTLPNAFTEKGLIEKAEVCSTPIIKQFLIFLSKTIDAASVSQTIFHSVSPQ